MSRIICAGHVNWDVTLHVDTLPEPDAEAVVGDQTQSSGGSAANTAAVLAGLDCEPLLLGSVGDDEYGLLAGRELKTAGVDCRHLQSVTDADTTVKFLIVDEQGQVMVLSNEGANEGYRASNLPQQTLRAASHLHLTSQRPETARRLAERARKADLSVSIDPGRRLDHRDYSAVIEQADIVFFNDREKQAARESGLLTDNTGVTIVKQGADGAEVRTDEQRYTHAGFSVDPVDTAGAGDAFAAGFLAARLDGLSDERALAVANACGALSVKSVGARSTISWDDVDTLLD